MQARDCSVDEKSTEPVDKGAVITGHSFFSSRLALLPALILAAVTAGVANAGECGAVGDLYVCNSIPNNVLQFDADGSFVCEFVTPGSGGLNGPTDLCWGPNGNLFVCGILSTDPTVEGAVWEYSGATGAFIRAFVPTAGGGLADPKGLAFGGADGNLYVLDRNEGNGGNIKVYDRASGVFVRTFELGERDQSMPRFDASGNLFISDETFDPTKPILEQWDPIAGVKVADLVFPAPFESSASIWGFIQARDEGHWLAADNFSNQIRRYDGATGVLLDIPVDASGPLVAFGLYMPVDLAHGPDGNVFVSSLFTYIPDIAAFTGAIHKYDGQTFEPLLVFGFRTQTEYRDDELWYPRGLEFKPQPGDFGGEFDGGDWDVDLADFAEFQRRFTGAGNQTIDAKSLLHFDFDHDGDLDADDFAAFQIAMTGPS